MAAAQAGSPPAPADRNVAAAATVSLTVRVTDGTRIRQRPARTGLTPAAVTEWLTGALPREIVQVSQGSGNLPVSREQQRRALIARAEAFSQVGAYEQATALREAALLLEPEDLAQQLTLILEYCRWQTAQSRQDAKLATEVNRKVMAGGRVEEEPIWEQTHAARLARFQRAARHTEDVIRRRQVNPLEAGTLLSQVSNALLISSLYKEVKQAPRTKAAYDEFCWRVLPLFPTLDGGLRQGTPHPVLRQGQAAAQPMAVEAQCLHAQAGLACLTRVSPALIGIGRDHTAWDSSRTLDDLYRWATQVAPPTIIVPEFVEILTGDAPPDLLGGIAAGRLRAEDVRRFCLRLQESKQPLDVFYARCGSLALRVYVDRASPLDAAALQDADTLLKSLYAARPELARMPAEVPAPGRSLAKLRAEIAKRLAKQGASVAAEADAGDHPGKRPDGPQDVKRHPLPNNPIPPSALCSRLAFTPIAGLTAEWHGWLKCTETLDVMWSCDAVYVMTQPGRIERILEIAGAKERVFAKDLIYGVVWDGQYLWVPCMTSGIHVLSPAGQVLGRIQAEQGLPAYEPVEWPREVRGLRLRLFSAPLQLYPIEPGKCLVLGKYGQHKRVWLATAARGPGEGTFGVTVVQTFTKVPDSQAPRRDADDDLAEIFEPGGLLEYPLANADDPRRLLIGRRWGDLQKGRRPLAVDLDSLAVSIFPVRLPPSFNEPFWWQWLAVDGRVFVSGSRGIDVFSPPTDESATVWTAKSVVTYPAGTSQAGPLGAPPAALLPQRAAIYAAGAHWFRIDRQQLSSEQFTQLPLPNRLCFEHYAASAQYGLLAWNRGDPLYRVAIDGPALDDQDLATQYPFVPPAQRAQHHRAVQAIRALGGSVDTWRSTCRHRVRPEHFSHWRTIVYLPQAWQGQGAALVHLKDLYNLRELVLVQADVADQGLAHVGQLTDLEALELVETKITDAGLLHLGGLRNLVYCRLEGPAGGDQFSDAGLRHLQALPGLERLTLYGRGFTDAGLKLFQDPRCRLREVRSLETAITKQGISEVTKLKPWFRCIDNETPPEFDGTGSARAPGTR